MLCMYNHISGCPGLPYIRHHPALRYEKPIILRIDDNGFVELVKRSVRCFYLQFAPELDF